MNDVLRYGLKRLLQGLITIVVISLVLFFLVRIIPNNPIDTLIGESSMLTEEQILQIRAQNNLDKPIITQYFMWIGNLLQGKLGTSFFGGTSVSSEIAKRLPFTLLFAIVSMVCTWLIAIPLGILTAYKQNKFIDRFLITTSTIISSMPGFWLALIMVMIFAVKLHIFPINGYYGLQSYILPILTNCLYFGGLMRITRSEVLSTMHEKYVVTAMSKGLPLAKVKKDHVLRNAIIPILIMAITGLPGIIGGSVVTETIFGLPGMGVYVVNAVQQMDYPVVQSIVLILSMMTVICNVLGDIMIAVLDPRARKALQSA